MNISLRICSVLLALTLAAIQPAFSQSKSDSKTNGTRQGLALKGLLFSRGSHAPVRTGKPAPDPVALGLAKAKVYKFYTGDYPGADTSEVFDTNVSTGVGTFTFGGSNPTTAFTVKGNLYQALAVPGSTAAIATAITTLGVIGGTYVDLSSAIHGFVDNAGTFTNVDFPSATTTELIGMDDAGDIVGDYLDASSVDHGYLDQGGVFTSIDFPGATRTAATEINSAGDIVGEWSDSTTTHAFLLSGGVFTSLDFPFSTSTIAWGINDSGVISGAYVDASSVSHGFLYSGGAWTRVDVGGATDTELLRVKNNGVITGLFVDDLTETHGVRGH